MSLLEQLDNDAPLSNELQQRLTEWERADYQFDEKTWTEEDRQIALEILQEFPDFVPTTVELAKFGSVDALLARYKALLSDLANEGMITHEEAEKSASTALSGGISIGGLIAEGKALKKQLLEARETRPVSEAFRKMREKATSAPEATV